MPDWLTIKDYLNNSRGKYRSKDWRNSNNTPTNYNNPLNSLVECSDSFC